jgi:hypothetical protein
MSTRGNTPRVRVEGGTGFKAESRGEAVYQRTFSGKGNIVNKTIFATKAVRKQLPETPGEGGNHQGPTRRVNVFW